MSEENSRPDPMPARSRSVLQIVGAIALYWVVSITMVFSNKFLVGGRYSEVDVSLFVAWIQCLTSVLMAILANWVRRRLCGHDVTLPPLSRKLLSNRDVLVLCFMFTGMLSFNNLCLKHVGIAFFQVARSMTLIFTVMLTAVLLHKMASLRVWGCCLIVAAGFVLGVDQENLAGTLSIRGVVYGITTSLFVAMNGVFTKRVLDQVKGNPVSVVFYMNVGASFLFLPLLIGTGQMQVGLVEKATKPVFMLLLLLSGFLSFFIGIASNLQIEFTSPTTHHISNNAKSVVQTLLAVLALGDVKSPLWWFSNFLVIGGAMSYTFIRMREDKAEKAAAAAVAAAAGTAKEEADARLVEVVASKPEGGGAGIGAKAEV